MRTRNIIIIIACVNVAWGMLFGIVTMPTWGTAEVLPHGTDRAEAEAMTAKLESKIQECQALVTRDEWYSFDYYMDSLYGTAKVLAATHYGVERDAWVDEVAGMMGELEVCNHSKYMEYHSP